MAVRTSFQDLLARLRRGDNDAASQVINRYAGRLIALTRSRLDERLRRRVDPEDVLQSVLRSFFVRLAHGEYLLRDWDSMWGLLVCITTRKCARALTRHRAASRDMGREKAGVLSRPELIEALDCLDRGPGPEDAALMEEALDQALRGFTTAERQAVLLSLRGLAPADVAGHVGCSVSKVYRVLHHVRERLKRIHDRDLG
jgi:RNA polymerase sigma-70 factor (ECF subfamily)